MGLHPAVRLSVADGGGMETEFRYELRQILGLGGFAFNSQILEEVKRLKAIEATAREVVEEYNRKEVVKEYDL